MARLDAIHPANAQGDRYVDTRCIDCGACRDFAPDVFGWTAGQSVVVRQPAPAEERTADLAELACPTQSIGRRSRARPAVAFPDPITEGVAICGHNAEDSYGANSFLVERPEGNVLVDSPRFTRRLVEPIAARGGLAHVVLTHQDDVADADRWAERFGARVWIHAADAGAAPYATDVVDGTDDVTVAPGLVLTPVPGHTRGSVVLTADERVCFTGDSLSWDRVAGDLAAWRDVAWYSWPEQAASLARLAGRHRFEWVLPGHGGRGRRPADEMHRRLVALAARMLP